MSLTAADVKGVYALLITPCKVGGDAVDARDTVDVDALEWFIENAISSGAHGIGMLGTAGECHTLTRDEWELVVRTSVEVVRRRVPLFCGSTTLNTRDTVERTRFVHNAGADGVLNGVPMWLVPSVDNAVQYYADIAEAVPDAAIMVYHNPAAFRVTIPPAAWGRLAQIPQVVAVKTTVADVNNTMGMIRAVGDHISVLVSDKLIYPSMMFGARGGWATRASISPYPMLRVYEACVRGDWEEANRIGAEVNHDWVPCTVEEFHMYDTPLVKRVVDIATGGKAGPTRRPFVHLPAHLEERAQKHAAHYLKLVEKYTPAKVATPA